ncbi:branched-chain amino acid transport system II carrier protein [Tenacibaculum maritimum]|uniref:branched-chain amino acid transport system II carrier protein n=1 Tax=Tenacibaculum maritimum TaxID=107401 RepID=UPI0012E66BA7|nr:branched-chain amino acid transport system II carrier protein [Tenacibaculum maritimum]CAA0155223.1 Branched-chain amino acid transport system II carrier protein [Tenacibaculum maritimum]CAA0188411.1 Branched-chain amino acid transport system II carrier protein [Tenacibaculum maritimum]
MSKTKGIFITGFALFSMFFGAGNLILPPFLGKNAGDSWMLVTIGFFITAVFIPILGIFAHAKLQGTMYDFGKKVSPLFSTIYCLTVYIISIALPAPRTASVTYGMTVQPYLDANTDYSLWVSTIYFILVFIFVMNRSKVLEILGQFLTPLIMFILLGIIFIGVCTSPSTINRTNFKTPFVDGVLEGYQTFDAIGAIVLGGVLVVSMNFKKNTSFELKKELISKAGLIAGTGLLVIYAGLIYNGALFNTTFTENATRTDILSSLTQQTLGNIGTVFLSALVALACFTTAVGIITGTADYFKGIFKYKNTYISTAIIGCVLGILIGQLDVSYIIKIAFPTLMLIYPITIMLILLNLVPEKWNSAQVFKAVIFITFVFSLPDFLSVLTPNSTLQNIKSLIPLGNYNLGWVLPALLTFGLVNIRKS